MMSVDESLMCSFQILKPGDKKPPNSSGNKKVKRFFLAYDILIYFSAVRKLGPFLFG